MRNCIKLLSTPIIKDKIGNICKKNIFKDKSKKNINVNKSKKSSYHYMYIHLPIPVK